MTTAEIIAAARDLVRLMKIRLEAIRFGINKPVPGKNDSWVPYSHEYAKAIALIESMQAELLRLHDGAEWTATPPTKPGHYWHKDVMEQKTCSVYGLFSCKGRIVEAYTLNLASDFGGFWLGPITPATASAMAVLRAENERLKAKMQEWDDKSNRILDAVNYGIAERDRLAAELAAVRQSIDAAHDWLTEAVGDYCKPAADESIETLAEHLRLRCESAAKRLTEAKAALTKAEAVISYCPTCSNALEKSNQTKRKSKP